MFFVISSYSNAKDACAAYKRKVTSRVAKQMPRLKVNVGLTDL